MPGVTPRAGAPLLASFCEKRGASDYFLFLLSADCASEFRSQFKQPQCGGSTGAPADETEEPLATGRSTDWVEGDWVDGWPIGLSGAG
jgi:hypothetical protein